MSKTNEKAIKRAAVSELEKLSLSIDTDLEVVANMPIEEVEDGLRQLGLDPNQKLPVRISQLVSEEVSEQQSLSTSNNVVDDAAAKRPDDAPIKKLPKVFLSYSHADKGLQDRLLNSTLKLRNLECIALDEVFERTYGRAAYALCDLELAEKVTVDVADALETLCEPTYISQDTCYSSRHKIRPNKSFLLDTLIFKKILPYKRQWKLEHKSGARNIDKDTMTIWFIESIMEFALNRDFLYTAIGICDLLYNYNSKDVMRIYEALNPNSSIAPDEYRRRKKHMIDALEKDFGDFLKLERVGNKKELRIKKPDEPSRIYWLINGWLNWLTPQQANCLLPDENENFGLGNYADGLYHFIPQFNQEAAEYLAEHERIHSLVDPYCFSSLVKRLNISSPEERLVLPTFSLFSTNRGSERHPFENMDQPLLEQEGKERIDAALHQRRKRREEMNLNTITVMVDETERGTVNLDKHHALRIRLKEGSGLIEFKGHDKKGSVPIGTHVLRWDEDVNSKEPDVYQINIQGKQILHYTIKYTRNTCGDLNGAILEDVLDAAPV